MSHLPSSSPNTASDGAPLSEATGLDDLLAALLGERLDRRVIPGIDAGSPSPAAAPNDRTAVSFTPRPAAAPVAPPPVVTAAPIKPAPVAAPRAITTAPPKPVAPPASVTTITSVRRVDTAPATVTAPAAVAVNPGQALVLRERRPYVQPQWSGHLNLRDTAPTPVAVHGPIARILALFRTTWGKWLLAVGLVSGLAATFVVLNGSGRVGRPLWATGATPVAKTPVIAPSVPPSPAVAAAESPADTGAAADNAFLAGVPTIRRTPLVPGTASEPVATISDTAPPSTPPARRVEPTGAAQVSPSPSGGIERPVPGTRTAAPPVRLDQAAAPAASAAPPAVVPPPLPIEAAPPPSASNPVAEAVPSPVKPLDAPRNVTPSDTGVGSPRATPVVPDPAASAVRTIVPAKMLVGAEPEYPLSLQQARVGGAVQVRFTISRDGSVTGVRAVSGPIPLRATAEAAVRLRRYQPATQNGMPVESDSSVIFTFDPIRRP